MLWKTLRYFKAIQNDVEIIPPDQFLFVPLHSCIIGQISSTA